MVKPKGWKREPARHSLASKGVKTKVRAQKLMKTYKWAEPDKIDPVKWQKQVAWLQNLDLEIRQDVMGNPFAPNEDKEDLRPVWWVQTIEDTSVGIYGFELSPTFHDKRDLSQWIEVMMEVMGDE